MKVKVIFFMLCFLCITSTSKAVRIYDSTTSDHGKYTTYATVQGTKNVETYGFQTSMGIPVGMIVTWPASGNVTMPDAYKYIECDGRSFSTTIYPELYAVLKKNVVPNLNGYFLRGTTDPNSVLHTYDHSLASHVSKIPKHHHSFEGELEYTDLAETTKALGQKYSEPVESGDLNMVNGVAKGQTFESDTTTWDVAGTATGQKYESTPVAWEIKNGKAVGQDFRSDEKKFEIENGKAAAQKIAEMNMIAESTLKNAVGIPEPHYTIYTTTKNSVTGEVFSTFYFHSSALDENFNYEHHTKHNLIVDYKELSSAHIAAIKGKVNATFFVFAYMDPSEVSGSKDISLSGTMDDSTVTGDATGSFSGTMSDSDLVDTTAVGTVSGTANESDVTGHVEGTLTGFDKRSAVHGRLTSGELKHYETYVGKTIDSDGNLVTVDGDTLTAHYTNPVGTEDKPSLTTTRLGLDETAPRHAMVRYFIRAIP